MYQNNDAFYVSPMVLSGWEKLARIFGTDGFALSISEDGCLETIEMFSGEKFTDDHLEHLGKEMSSTLADILANLLRELGDEGYEVVWNIIAAQFFTYPEMQFETVFSWMDRG